MEHDHMIEAFATNGANHPLDIGSLPRRARCRQDFANAHVSHVFSEVIAKDRVAVAQEVARELGKGKCLAQLLSGPICGIPVGVHPASTANCSNWASTSGRAVSENIWCAAANRRLRRPTPSANRAKARQTDPQQAVARGQFWARFPADLWSTPI